MEDKINELKTFIYFFSRFRRDNVFIDSIYVINTIMLYFVVMLTPFNIIFLKALVGISLTYLAILGLFVLSPQYIAYKQGLESAE